ncbi:MULTISPECIES: formate dehydrogenase accessory protein FdhE [Methylobacterium]|uniref:formate dehydrogenase accessory protein FdhE domain-containing protein n=1 Tax=Methylobacterium TaxID=407 RepID=UPI002F361220
MQGLVKEPSPAPLRVRLAERAARLDTEALKPVADGVCPCCGGAPAARVVVAWTPADKVRYLSCSLCGTYWNHVRIRCTACGDGDGVSYYGLDEVSKDVQVETCTTCHSYIKHLHQDRAPALDPVADDIASCGLDLTIAEEGFRRAGLNLLFVISPGFRISVPGGGPGAVLRTGSRPPARPAPSQLGMRARVGDAWRTGQIHPAKRTWPIPPIPDEDRPRAAQR